MAWQRYTEKQIAFAIRQHESGTPIAEIIRKMREAFEHAEEGEALVLPMLRTRSDPSLRSTLLAAISRAGLTAWPRLWHNLRSTRPTELAADYPAHVVCAWMGNSEKIAAKHYLQVTDDYRRAAHIPAHSGTKRATQESSAEKGGDAKTPVIPVLMTPEDNTSDSSIAAGGLEPPWRLPPGGF